MSKTLKTVALIAGAVAVVATGGAALGLALGGAGMTFLGASAATIATIASAVAGVASLGAQLTAKTPPARGSITQVLIATDPPQPYLMGESYFAGVLRHDTGYGAPLKKVPNPYRGMVIDYSGGGPVEQLVEQQVDFTTIDAYYSGFLATDTQLGATPEASALVPPLSAPMPEWDATSKLSGQAAILWNFKFDKDGKRFASGLPVLGAVWKGVKVYDPRLDSTYPGGSGAHRINNEATWTYSANPALHALAYAYGRYQNGVQVFGIGVPSTALRIADFVTLANVCDANGWTVSGVAYEPSDRWNNLKDILAAGGAEPVFAGGTLGVRIRTPQVALDTITEADLADEQASVTSMQSYRDRLNTIVPKYRSPDHNWEMVAADAVKVTAYETEDGEEKVEEVPFNFVRDVDQAAQLAAYKLVDGREFGPITLVCMPRLRAYRPGECLALDIPALGLDTDAIILTRRIDPATMKVTLTLIGETPAKHAYALGLTGTPPPTPTLGQTSEERDDLKAAVANAPPDTAANEAAMLALEVVPGTIVKRLDTGQSYVRNEGTTGTITDWTLIGMTTSAASSVSFSPAGSIAATNVQAAIEELDTEKLAASLVSAFGLTLIDDADAATARTTLGLGNVENKSSATIRGELTSGNVTSALTYTPTSVNGLTGVQSVADFKTGLSLVKGDVGLGNVDNTSDANKPVSTAQQAALDLKANLAGPTTFSGTTTFITGVGTTLALGGAAIGTDKLAVTGTTTLNGKLTIVSGSGFRFRNGATDGFDVTQLNTNSWGWTGLSGGMWFNMQNTHLIVVDGRMGIRTAAGTDPTAHLEIGVAGTTALAPIRLKTASAALLTTPLSGVIETDGTDLYWTNNAGTRKKVTVV